LESNSAHNPTKKKSNSIVYIANRINK
jgi:hypothetical protein